jgi:hypothetical protein
MMLLSLHDRWGRLEARDRRAMALGVAVLLPVVVWIGVVRPYLGALETVRADLEAERGLLAREEGLLASADQLPGRLEQATLLLEQEAAGLIRVENELLAEARLADALQEEAAGSRVLIQEVRSVQPNPDAPDPAYGVIRLGLRAESDLQGLATFLNRIEGSSTLLRVLELSVEPARTALSRDDAPTPADMGALTFSMIVEGFWSAPTTATLAADDGSNPRLTGIPR